MGTGGLAHSNSCLDGKWPLLGSGHQQNLGSFPSSVGSICNMEASEEGIAHDLKSIEELHGGHKGEVQGQSPPVGGEWLGLSNAQVPA